MQFSYQSDKSMKQYRNRWMHAGTRCLLIIIHQVVVQYHGHRCIWRSHYVQMSTIFLLNSILQIWNSTRSWAWTFLQSLSKDSRSSPSLAKIWLKCICILSWQMLYVCFYWARKLVFGPVLHSPPVHLVHFFSRILGTYSSDAYRHNANTPCEEFFVHCDTLIRSFAPKIFVHC